MMNNYELPPEWTPQKAIWLAFPHNEETWTREELVHVELEYCYFISQLSAVVDVNIMVLNQKHEIHITETLKKEATDFNNINFFIVPTNDAWIRDFGPDFVFKDGIKTLINWGYNAWGEKYPPFDLDNNVPIHIAKITDSTVETVDMILEGGSFEVNGKGDLMTTKSCLLNSNRNPNLSKEIIETNLKKYFGVQNIIWLSQGITGDDTDGHIDDFARFVNEQTIVCVHTEDKNHPDYEVLNRVYKELINTKLYNGKTPILIKLPTPSVIYYKGEELPCSYANFLITNNRIFVPIFNCEQDENAISTLQKIFKTRKVIGIPCSNIIIGLGSLHCLSKHETDIKNR